MPRIPDSPVARALTRTLPAVVAVIALIPAALAVSQTSPQPGTELLPDLDQEMPTLLEITRAGPKAKPTWRLGFRSAVRNIGAGPLIIDGRRPSKAQRNMAADQVIEHNGAPAEVVGSAGRLRYTRSPDHEHWHLLGFERYELRRPGGGAVLARDRKTGFCLGDRYEVTTRELPARAPEPVYTSRCGLERPGLLGIREGISVGYGDDYDATLEGQWLPLNGLKAGRYLLIHRVNADRGLRELTYDNNESSLLIRLHWRGREPEIRVLATCPTTAECTRAKASAARGARPRAQTVATGLEIPWEIAFLPDERALVTERPGRVRLLSRNGRLRREPVARVPVSAYGEGGLLGLAVDPQFSANRFVYLYFTTTDGMRLERRRFTGSRLVREASLLDGVEAGRVHDSGRIAFGPDGRLYVSTGDAGESEHAQDPASLNGKMLALSPAQYRGATPAVPEVVASGLRNSQGFDWQPGTNRLVANDHGPTGFDGPEGYDEVNAIDAGGNYGWPEAISDDTDGGRFVAPLRVYRGPIAPSGATFVSRPRSRGTGAYVLAGVVGEQPLLAGRYGRLRTVVEGPRGCLYVLTSNRDGRGVPVRTDDRILRIAPPGVRRCS
jgi:glucose/arabinose dehydrogenase